MHSKPAYRLSSLCSGLVIVFMIILAFEASAQKTDRVYFVNGDEMLGEILALQYGKLKLDSKYAGTVSLKWYEITSISTDKLFIIQTKNGRLYEGSIEFKSPESFRIIAQDTAFTTVRSDVIRLTKFDNRLWNRFEGDLGLGLDYSTGSEVLQINVYTDISYIGSKYRGTVGFDNVFTNVLNDTTRYTKRDLTLTGFRYFGKSWFIAGEYKFEQNSELGFDARHTLTASGGKNLFQSQRTDMLVAVGFNYNRERFTSEEGENLNSNNVEMPISTRFQLFKYIDPEVDLDITFTYYPSLTDLGRQRTQASISIGIEFVNDFWFKVKFYDDFDNRVPSTGKKSNDYGINTTISYTFNK